MVTLDLSDNGMGPQGGTYMAAALADNEFILNVVRLHQCLDHLFFGKKSFVSFPHSIDYVATGSVAESAGSSGRISTGRYAKAEQGNEDTELIK